MGSKYPVLKPEQIIRRMEKMGFRLKSQRGSHRKYEKDGKIFIIPMHDTVAKGTLKSILEQAGVTLDEFLDQ